MRKWHRNNHKDFSLFNLYFFSSSKGSSTTVKVWTLKTSQTSLTACRPTTAGYDGSTTSTTWFRYKLNWTGLGNMMEDNSPQVFISNSLLLYISVFLVSRLWCLCLCCRVRMAGSTSCMMDWMQWGWISRYIFDTSLWECGEEWIFVNACDPPGADFPSFCGNLFWIMKNNENTKEYVTFEIKMSIQ